MRLAAIKAFLAQLSLGLAVSLWASDGRTDPPQVFNKPAANENSSIAVAPQRKYINSLDDFLLHTQAHIRRVEILGTELLRAFPDRFKDVNPTLLSAYLRSHDLSKVSATRFTPTGVNMAEKLYEFYGKVPSRQFLTPAETATREKLVSVVRQINFIDQQVSESFFGSEYFKRYYVTKQGVDPSHLSEVIEQYKTIEKIADLVDRGSSPVSAEEFNKIMEPASKFLKKDADRSMALMLEKKYGSLTRSATFEVYKRITLGRCKGHALSFFLEALGT